MSFSPPTCATRAELEAAGLVDRGRRVHLRDRSDLVLWVRNDRSTRPHAGPCRAADAGSRRVAIANPAHAPYGRAAVAALEHAGVYAAVRNKLVFGENVSQAAQFAQCGNATPPSWHVAGARTRHEGRRPLRRHSARISTPRSNKARRSSGPRQQSAHRARFVEYLKQPSAMEILRILRLRHPRPVARRYCASGLIDSRRRGLDRHSPHVELAIVVCVILMTIALPVAYWLAFYAVALEIHGRIGRCAPARAATHGARLLCPAGARLAQPDRARVGRRGPVTRLRSRSKRW